MFVIIIIASVLILPMPLFHVNADVGRVKLNGSYEALATVSSSSSTAVTSTIGPTVTNITAVTNTTTVTNTNTVTSATTLISTTLKTIVSVTTSSLTLLDPPNAYVLITLIGFIFLLVILVVVIRSRLAGDLDRERQSVRELQSQLQTRSETTQPQDSAESALRRLFDLGLIEPKEYMEKKVLAERLGRRMSAKKLLDEGLITKEQYEALVRKEQQASK